MGDVFYRWDGFRSYASFSEFLPNVALLMVLWTIVAVFTALLVWLPFRAFEWICIRAGWKIRAYHLMLFSGILILTDAGVWEVKRRMWPHVQTSLVLEGVVFLITALVVVFLAWLVRNRAERWVDAVYELITPLVWIFGIVVILSVPLLAYFTLKNEAVEVSSQEGSHVSVQNKNQPNIILVTFDTLTARDMSVYGYNRPTTPFISEWAKTASLFTRLQAESNATTQTVASLMTGKRLWTHQTYHIKGSRPLKGDIESLPLLLRKSGYYNIAFVVNPAASIKILGISNGFDAAPVSSEFSNPLFLKEIISNTLYRFFGDKFRLYDWFVESLYRSKFIKKIPYQDRAVTPYPPEKVFTRFLSILDNYIPEPFFVWIHLFPPHSDYLPPKPYMGMFDNTTKFRTYKNQKAAYKIIGYFRNRQFSEEAQQAAILLGARYDEFIRYCDKQFEEFVIQLSKRSQAKNTIIILSSDHGESFEHDYFGHSGPHLYEQVTHVPLIIKEPDQTEGRIINNLVEQIDIPATILDLINIPVPSWMEGRSLVPLMRDEELPSRPSFSMTLEKNPSRGHQITKGTVAVWEGDYKLIHYLQENKSLLFNLKEDSDELNNLFDKESEVGQHLLALIKDNLKEANERIGRENK